MGHKEKLFDSNDKIDMPVGYPRIRQKMSILAMKVQENRDIMSSKLLLYSGVQNLSVDNVNTMNERRFDIYSDLLTLGYPHFEIEKPKKEEKKNDIQDLISEYKRIFKKDDNQQKQDNIHSGTNDGNS
jgi:hypothetical protein